VCVYTNAVGVVMHTAGVQEFAFMAAVLLPLQCVGAGVCGGIIRARHTTPRKLRL